MGGIVSCGEAATTTLWIFGILFHNPSAQPLFTAPPFALCPSYCIMDLEYKFGGQLWTHYGMS